MAEPYFARRRRVVRTSTPSASASAPLPGAPVWQQPACIAGDPRLANSHRLDAARAGLLERAGERAAAIEHYRRAATRTASTPERDYRMLRAARLAGA